MSKENGDGEYNKEDCNNKKDGQEGWPKRVTERKTKQKIQNKIIYVDDKTRRR